MIAFLDRLRRGARVTCLVAISDSYDIFNPLGVKYEKLRKRTLENCIIPLNDQHHSFIMSPNVLFRVRNHVQQVCAAKQHVLKFVILQINNEN